VGRPTEIDGGCELDASKGYKQRGRFDFGVLFPKGSLWDLVTSLHEQRSNKAIASMMEKKMTKLVTQQLWDAPNCDAETTS
jgi:hypothetical protein